MAIDGGGRTLAAIAAVANLRSRVLHLPYGDQGLLMTRRMYDHAGGYASVPIMEDVMIARALARTSHGGRQLPPTARHTLIAWLAGAGSPLENAAARAHQRLLREFLEEHLGDGRPLRAFIAWEEQRSPSATVVEPV